MMDVFNSPVSEGVLVISCDIELPPLNIIRNILGKEELPFAVRNSSVQGYLWSVDTKYYSAEVYLYALEKQEIIDTELCKAIKAVVLYIDNAEPSSLEDVKNWIPYLKSIKAEVKLLICRDSREESKGRKSLINWCVQNEFELVELNSDEDEDESDFKDVNGYERVRQSLQSHQWESMTMKVEVPLGRRRPDNDSLTSEDSGVSQGDSSIESIGRASSSAESAAESRSEKKSKTVKVQNEVFDLEDQLLSNVLSGDDPNGESLEALFSKFNSMKETAEGLSGEERKKFAEEVAIAFWNAIGGDADEIAELDDD